MGVLAAVATMLQETLLLVDQALSWGVANPQSWLVVCLCSGIVLHGLWSRRPFGAPELLVLFVLYATLSSDSDSFDE